jgi:hypothetical protein
MPQFGFYTAAAGVPVLGGLQGLLIAWNPLDKPSSAVDEIDLSHISLYSWIGRIGTSGIAKVKSKSPIHIPAENCPDTLDGFPGRDFFIRFGVKPGGSGGSLICDGWLEVFEGNNRVYGIVPPTQVARFELAQGTSALGFTELSMQDRVTSAGLEDTLEGWDKLLGQNTPAKELWRALMTPNAPLTWSPV